MGGTLRPAPQWVQISVPLLAYTSCRAGPKILCSCCPGAHIARMQGWPDVLQHPLLSRTDRVPAATPCPRSSQASREQSARGLKGALGSLGMATSTQLYPCFQNATVKRARAAEEVFPLGSDVHLLPQPSIWNSGSHFSLLPINIADLLLYTWWVVNCIPPLL